jgi:hypothetical protein
MMRPAGNFWQFELIAKVRQFMLAACPNRQGGKKRLPQIHAPYSLIDTQAEQERSFFSRRVEQEKFCFFLEIPLATRQEDA